MRETHDRPADPLLSQEWRYDRGEDHPTPALARLWADAHGGLWLESADGQRVVVPREERALVAKRIKEAAWR